MSSKHFVMGLVALLGLGLGVTPASAQLEAKVATLAPKGSAWAKIMEKGAKDIEARTSGRVKIKYFFGGQQGDERDVVRKMKLGQIDGSALTAVGLGLIQPEVRVLELPFLFRSDKQLDYVRNKMAPDFEAKFDAAGYVMLAWGDVGWVHLYSNIKVENRNDLAHTKMWAWTDDPIVRELFKLLGVNGVPLGVPDVLPSLQTGTIDACYGSPLAAVALQWYTKVRFATTMPISYSIGALVMKKDVFTKLSAEDQKSVREASKVMGDELMKTVRKDNERAKKAMEKSGVMFVTSPAAMVTELEKNGQKVWGNLVGKLYPGELLKQLQAHLAQAPK
jgi:TRAP-type C4-dicarboxylate transport system substrate-binding protein